MREVIRLKREDFGYLLQSRSESDREKYRGSKLVMKRGMRQHKRKAEEGEGKIGYIFRGNKKLRWSEVHYAR